MKKSVLCVTALVETSPQALPLGAACICSSINHSKDTKDIFSARIFDFSLEDKYDLNKIAGNICSEKNLFAICFSVYVWNRKVLEELNNLVKKLRPEIVTMAGGPEVTANPFSFNSFDWLTAGEGECSVVNLLASLDLGTEVDIQGVYKNDGKNLVESYEGKALRSMPCPVENLSSPYLDGTLDVKKYGGALWELARGCPFKCSYCYESKGEKKIKYFPMERIEKELDYFQRNKVPQVFVLDPTYNASKQRALEMLKLIKKKTPDTFYYFEARAEFIDRQLAKAFAEIPCSLQFGLQSADEEVLKKVNRTFNKKTFQKNIGYLNETGVIFGFDLIYGLPGDTFKGFKSSIDFALALYPNNLELFCLSVLPGTDLADKAKDLGLTWQKEVPYLVTDSTSFHSEGIERARSLSSCINFFYNDGRAVPWFMNLIRPLRLRPSEFFTEFEKFCCQNDIDCESNDFEKITQVQIDFISKVYKDRHQEKMIPAATDLISMNNALSLVTAEGKESVLELSYHPDDLMSEYGTDILFFSQNAGRYRNRTRVFGNKNGPDWQVLKK